MKCLCWLDICPFVQMMSCWSSAASTKGWSTRARRSRRWSIRAWSPALSTPSACAATSTTTAASATKCAVPATTTLAIMCATSWGTENAWRAGQILCQAAKQVQWRQRWYSAEIFTNASFYTDWQNTLEANQINQNVFSQIKWKAIKKWNYRVPALQIVFLYFPNSIFF